MFLLLACAAPEAPSLDGATNDGLYTLTASIAPAPLVVGDAVLDVTSDGDALTVGVRMLGMDHGVDEEPVVTSEGAGAWTIEVAFPMSGTWSVHFLVDGASGLDAADWLVDVG
jgi:hypothetical protein